MGHDVITIANHKLNTASICSLAEDLHQRLGEPIAYGYRDDWINYKTGEEGTFEFVEQGRIGQPGLACPQLADEYYIDRHYYKKPDKGEMMYKLYGPTQYSMDVEICHDNFYSHIHFDSRWWNFVRYFQGEFADDEGWERYVRLHRLAVQSEVKLLSGTIAIYGDDQGPSQFIGDVIVDHPFEQVKEKVLTEFGTAVLDVASFQHRYNEGFFEQTEWLAFIDNFSDLQ